MKTTVYFRDFTKAFDDAGRGTQFSTAGLRILFKHIEEIEEDMGDQYELDVIALCCDFAEALTHEIARDYNVEGCVMEFLEDNGALVGITPQGTIVYRQF